MSIQAGKQLLLVESAQRCLFLAICVRWAIDRVLSELEDAGKQARFHKLQFVLDGDLVSAGI